MLKRFSNKKLSLEQHFNFCHFSFSQCLFSYISSPRRIPRERCKGASKTVQRSALCRSRRELSNEHLLAKITNPTSIYLQKSASIQPRTSPSTFGGKIQFNIIQSCPKSAASLHQLRRPSGLDNLETSGSDSFEASARSEWENPLAEIPN